MSRTYKAIGINLKSMPMGESDRLLTILTREFGLVRAVAMGSRKHNSRLGGRSELFVVNELLIAKGRSLDKIAQAETLESYPRLGQDLQKLVASQYLAELCLGQALSDQPQDDLFCLLNEHLARLERSPASHVLPHLTHAVFQLLVLAGVAPQVHICCVTRQVLTPDYSDRNWRVGFSVPAGGTVTLAALERLMAGKPSVQQRQVAVTPNIAIASSQTDALPSSQSVSAAAIDHHPVASRRSAASALNTRLSAVELTLLQHLAAASLPEAGFLLAQMQPNAESHKTLESGWRSIERVLRVYAQYHFDRPIRSATLIDACFDAAD